MNNDFGCWVRRMRRYTDTTLMDMAEAFAAKPSTLCGLEVNRDGKVFTERQKKLIEYYFRLVCEEKGLVFPEPEKAERIEESAEKITKNDKEVDFLRRLFGMEG